jgi:transposase-like protein
MFTEMGEQRRRFTREFKEEAVKLSERGDLTIRQVAADLDMHEKALHRTPQRGVRGGGSIGTVTRQECVLRRGMGMHAHAMWSWSG